MINTNTATAPYAALLLRLSLGVMFIAHALLKLVVFTLPGTVRFFESLGYPGFLAYVVFGAELAGGALLVLGVYTRWVSLALIPILIGAALVHVPNGWVFSAPNGGWEYPVFLVVASAVQALLGDGALALRASTASLVRQPA
ncbi:membrane protein [Sulfuricaulis limicola]|uniref:Membrane protein n=1 Tax=Sulfuricaulis limicola TaxID=1620215 RepID=A0A1B4XCV2_9GAMM|nr:DoxX family protein [Sulfuricaulis limicola]BAV32621.1 membrane protein [Sulfuricaulis limicola]